MVGVEITKPGAAARERIDIRRVSQRVAKAADRICAQLVWHKYEDVGSGHRFDLVVEIINLA